MRRRWRRESLLLSCWSVLVLAKGGVVEGKGRRMGPASLSCGECASRGGGRAWSLQLQEGARFVDAARVKLLLLVVWVCGVVHV